MSTVYKKLFRPAAGFLVTCAVCLGMIAPRAVQAAPGGGVVQETTAYGLSVSAVSLEAEYGYGDTAKGSRYVPVRVTLTNQDDRLFTGTVQILSMETDNSVYRYEYPVDLEVNESRNETYDIPLGTKADQLYVILVDDTGNEVIRQRLKLNVSQDAAELLIGVLSDTPEELDYMDGVGVNYSMLRTKTTSLTAHMMPVHKNDLDLLDVILVTNYDLGQLNRLQLDAILAWVRNGGILLLGTGERVNETLGPLASILIEEPYGMPEKISVDMGVEYATNGPGDSYIEASCADISLKGGTVVLSSDQLPILTSVEEEKGKIAVAAFDFAEIAPFCREQHSYVEKLFVSLIGEEKISWLANATYNGQSAKYWSIQNVINTGDVGKLPPMMLYMVVVVIYLVLVGPALYLFLKKKDIRSHYRFAACMLALLFTGIIYLMGSKTRFKDVFFNYASIKDTTGQTISETTVLNVRTPYNKSYQVNLDPDYSIRPITKNYYYDTTASVKFTGIENARVTISRQEDATAISVRDTAAFDPKYFILEKEEKNQSHEGFDGEITSFDGKVYGTVTNRYETTVENAAVILYGQMVLLGDLKAGETKSLDGLKVVYQPMHNSYMAAGRITGSDAYKKADINDREYMDALERMNLMMYYLDNYFSVSDSTARIVGFGIEEGENRFFCSDLNQSYGRTLLTESIDVNTEVNGLVYRFASARQPKNNNAGYNIEMNAMYGVDPLILEYSLGSDLEIDKIRFDQVSEEFTTHDNYTHVMPFMGSVSFYNYDTGNYDKIMLRQNEFTGIQLSPYLSPSNTLTVKYVPETVNEYNWNIILPTISIVGREM